MKKNLDKLNQLIKDGAVDVEDFYSIGVSGYKVTLQGNYSLEMAEKYKAFDFKVDKYLIGKKDNIIITLT